MVMQADVKSFEVEVIQSDKPVLVDFWAPWCGPCKMIAPVLEELAGEMQEIKIVKVNVDENGPLAQKYGVMSIPTLAFFKNGSVAERWVGFMPKQELTKRIKNAIG